MKKIALAVLSLSLLLSGCSTGIKKEEKVVDKSGKSKEQAIVPKYSISEDYYKTTVPFDPGSARGLVVQGLNSRLDIDEFETGLMRIAKESFSTKDYLFQGGKFLEKEMVQMLVKRKRTDAEQKELEEKLGKKEADKLPNIGLNPALDPGSESLEVRNRKKPIYLSNILEHDYYARKGDQVELGGIVIGLAMNSVHYYNEEHGYPREAEIKEEEMLAEGKRMAQEILSQLQQKKPDVKNVPITFAIYRQGAKSTLVPGKFVSYAQVDKGSDKVGDWKAINEKYYLFPSESAKTDVREDYTTVENFKAKLSEYFKGDYTAVVGTGFYKDDQLKEMKIEIPVQFNGKAEVIGFTQYVAGLVMQYFPNYVKVQVTIKSVERPEAIIIRDAKQDEPFVKILD
ncbi:CamS family sex pheromone protein [Bacillus cereus]|uniref:CamS family sex pheromone protein n=1 Tax=Bacillus arachidis TaxID=2819290 RepID=A0ABS3P3K7_9BACI|nr:MULTISPECIES: CamS family sex pheromone protein [Bacillus]MBO1627777.1 CamS family sex pheromone protein [Bacillus arachidis]PFD97238.1 CamS family sex pheromone protein [Bacillus sp. AFS023182]PGX90304.1 CamS family sex pheromone protein [Bacillus cereus]SDZ18079.1 Protein involved in sex pheromone biosynthesis [Bacillus sp. 166amftsu]